MTRETENRDLASWLQWLEQLHPSTIDLGLERVKQVWQRMELSFGASQIVIVGGTNGKGSSVAMLSNIILTAGYTVGSYTSPHLLTYNERVCVNGKPAEDAALCAAFAAIEAVRDDISLTYFEFGTLAALHYFASLKPDFIILEVGLGGRLDAVNIIDPHVSILTNVALDHMDWLGSDREQIGFEKAGIFRPGNFAIYGENDMPASVREYAGKLSTHLLHNTEHYQWQPSEQGTTWRWQGVACTGEPVTIAELPQLPFPHDNAAGVIQALLCLQGTFRAEHIREGLRTTRLPGRFQNLQYKGRRVILDVAHNPHAAAYLVRNIQTHLAGCPIQLVLGMLADKDSSSVVQLLAPVVTHLHAATLPGERGSSADTLYNHARHTGISAVTCYDTVVAAFDAACAAAGTEGVVVVTGSFFTVAAVLELI